MRAMAIKSITYVNRRIIGIGNGDQIGNGSALRLVVVIV